MHQCAFCQKAFPSASKLERHHLIHTGQKPFTCLFCGKAFRQSVHLKKHTETHTGKNINLDYGSNSSQHDSYTQYLFQSGHANYSESMQETYEQDFSDNITLSSPLFAPADAHTEYKRETLTQEHGHTSPEIKCQRQHGPQVSHHNGIPTDGRFLSHPLFDSTDGTDILDNSGCYTESEHTCTTCMKSFSSSLQLQIHLPVHDPITPYECGTCGRSFKSQTQILFHLESHDNFVLAENLPISRTERKSHREFIRPTVNHQCPSCSKTFCSPSKLKRHFLTHTGQKPFSCVICEKTFRQATHLKTHLYAHRNLPSQIDVKAIHVQNDGNQHPSNPDDPVNAAVEMEVQCEISVSAPQSQNKNEIKSQENVKVEGDVKDDNHQSSSCSETLDTNVVNRQHDMIHRDHKPFQCPVCNKAFRLSVHLKRHQVTHRNQNKSPLLDPRHGESEFRSDFHLDTRTTSPDPSDVKALGLDIRVKPEICSQPASDEKVPPPQERDSPTPFDNPPLAVQSTSHGMERKSPQCLKCLKCFPSPSKLNRHMLSHTGQRPFSCQMCDKSFRQQTHLRVHSRTHLWSKYHKQRQTHFNRPPSRSVHVNKSSTVPPATWPLGGELPRNSQSKTNCDLASMTQVSQARTLHVSKSPPPQRSGQSTRLVPKAAASDKHEGVSPVKRAPPKAHQCCFCLKDFPSASKLQRHNLVHTDLRPHLCLACGKTFRQAPHLKAHQRTHSTWRPVGQVAGQRTPSVTAERTQPPQYPKISICVPPQTTGVETDALRFGTDGAADRLSGTLYKKRKSAPFKLHHLPHLKMRDKMTYGNKAAHSCVLCQKSFTTPYKLSRHHLIHSGVKPYKCSVCPKRFTQANHLKKHKLVHDMSNIQGVEFQEQDMQGKPLIECVTPEIKYSAQLPEPTGEGQRKQGQPRETSSVHHPVTGEAFSHASDKGPRQRVPVADTPAMATEHNDKQRDNCESTKPYRSSSFPSALAAEIQRQSMLQDIASPASLPDERNAHTNDRQVAFENSGAPNGADSYIKQVGVVDNSLTSELPYWCEPLDMNKCHKCHRTFNSNMDLELHTCVSGSQDKLSQASQYQCAVCFKEFVSPSKLKRHYVTHTGQRPFRCEVCDKTFTQSTHLKTHARFHRK